VVLFSPDNLPESFTKSTAATMMLRSALSKLAWRHSPSVVAFRVLPPMASVIAGSSLFSTRLDSNERDDQLFEQNYSDKFDESDTIELGKQELSKKIEETANSNKTNQTNELKRRPYVWPQFGDGFDDFFPRDDSSFSLGKRFDLMSLFEGRHSPFSPSMSLLRASPGYEIHDSERAYEIVVDVPSEIQASDMKIEMKHNKGTSLYITGHREIEQDGSFTRKYFEKRFSIGNDVDVENITANLSDGLLVIKAPKIQLSAQEEQPGTTIPITEQPHTADQQQESTADTPNDRDTADDNGPSQKNDNMKDEDNSQSGETPMKVPTEGTRYGLADHSHVDLDRPGPTKEYPN
jgi:HSP20 family protein